MDPEESVNTLTEDFSSLIGTDPLPTDIVDNSSCPRLALYKNRGYALDQERRWRAELENSRRKQKRKEKFHDNRKIDDSFKGRTNPWSSTTKSGKNITWDSRFVHLMLAEWFLFMPPNFKDIYLMKLCPKGRHVFVIASKGQTNIYSRAGLCLATLLTRLPGGGLGQSSSQMHRYQTMLDCIMIGVPTALFTHRIDEDDFSLPAPAIPEVSSDSNSTENAKLILKVLDMTNFRETSYAKQPFRARMEWLEGFYRPQIEAWEPTDIAKFEIVPTFNCDQETMNSVFSVEPSYEVDGVLLYHGDVTYRRGATPLVGWLKPYMIPEWFPSLTVHEKYLEDMSSDYVDYLADIRSYEAHAKVYKDSVRKAAEASISPNTDMITE